MRKLLFIILFLTSFQNLSAQDNTVRKTLAVMNIKANNCPSALGYAMSDMFTELIFKSKMFVLLERNQLELVMQTNRIDEKACTSEQCLARLGDLLKVDKMITGSISKLDDYRIDVRVFDVKTRSIELALSDNIDELSDLGNAVKKIGKKIINYYKGIPEITGNCDIVLSGNLLMPFGDLTALDMGYGLNLDVYLNKIIGNQYQIVITSGFWSFSPNIDSTRFYYAIPLLGGISHNFNLGDNVFINPVLSAGGIISIINHDVIKDRTYTEEDFKTERFFNPAISLRINCNILLAYSWYFQLTPAYTVFYEQNKTGQMLGCALGIRKLF